MSNNADAGHQRKKRVPCNCGWEVRFGYGVAVTLAIFEAKRLFMLILEMLAEWQVIRFAGGFRPVVLTLVDISCGFPTALTAVRAIRARNVHRCCVKTKRTLRCLLLVTAICAAMNAATLISIGCHISVKQEALIGILNSSMVHYVNSPSYKYALDEIQFVFQCCGHSSYADWFLLDWQRVDYAPREEMAMQSALSDEEYRDRGVPFSCCNLRAMTPCMHVEIMDGDVRSINTKGCAQVMGPVLLRVVIIAYVMTSTLLVTQILLGFLIVKIGQRLPVEMRRANYPPVIFADGLPGSQRSIANSETEWRKSSASLSDWRPRSSKATRGTSTRRARRIRRVMALKCIHPKDGSSSNTSDSSDSSNDGPVRERRARVEAARIKPSIHEEHTISKKRFHGPTR